MQQQIAKKNTKRRWNSKTEYPRSIYENVHRISIIDLIRFDIYNIVELEACRRLYKRVMYDIWTI